MNDLTQLEHLAFLEFLACPGPVREALEKFSKQRKLEQETQAAESLRTIPRLLEQACDAAAKAEVYAGLMKDLGRFANQR